MDRSTFGRPGAEPCASKPSDRKTESEKPKTAGLESHLNKLQFGFALLPVPTVLPMLEFDSLAINYEKQMMESKRRIFLRGEAASQPLSADHGEHEEEYRWRAAC